jgi:putative membrane protein
VKEYLALYLRGLLMGAADVVPGVSGGTMAFITGIYDRLLCAINSVMPALAALVRDRSLNKFFRAIDGCFLVCIFTGILTSVFSLASVISHALATQPILVWAFFFGLIVASIYVLRHDISEWNVSAVLSLLLGAFAAWALTSIELPLIQADLFGAFLSGAVAITAMILPGISGSLLLLLMGTYSFILGAVKNFEISVIAVFASGCFVGLILSARVLVWALHKYRNLTVAFLVGLMIGALNKVWPWKLNLSYRENSHGELVPFAQQNVGPINYEAVSGHDSQILYAIFLFLCAYFTVVAISYASKRLKK